MTKSDYDLCIIIIIIMTRDLNRRYCEEMTVLQYSELFLMSEDKAYWIEANAAK